MAVNVPDDRLPCGHHIDQLWEHLADDIPDLHARKCPHCQAVLSQIRPLFAATSELAAEPVRPPADLSGRVMAVVGARVAPATRIALPGPAGIRLSISERAAASILRAVGDTIEGVRARSCRLTPSAHGISNCADLRLSISLRFGMPALAAARAVRMAIRAAAGAQLGLTLDRIDIEVVDIHFA
jgi:hypothetical protein